MFSLPALLVLAPGLLTLRFGFVYDDSLVVQGAGDQVRIDPVGLLLSFKRTLRTFSFAFDEWMFRGEPWGYHLDSVLWASANALLVMMFAYMISDNRRTSLAAGVLFAVHPVHVETVANVANRKDLLAFAFGVGAITVVLGPLLRKQSLGIGRLVMGAVLMLLCILSKEVVAFGVLGMICLLALFPPQSSNRTRTTPVRTTQRLILTTCSLAAGILMVKHFLLPMSTLYASKRLSDLSSGLVDRPGDWFIRSLAGVSHSATLLFFPLHLSADHSVPSGGRSGMIEAAFGMVFLVGTLVLSVRISGRDPLGGFGLMWLAPTMVPVMNLLPLSRYFVAERYLYLPSLGATFIGAAILDGLFGDRQVQRPRGGSLRWPIALAAITFLAGVQTVQRIAIWRDSRSLWSATCRDTPSSWRARLLMGVMFFRESDYDRAMKAFLEASRIIPSSARPQLLMGEVLMKKGAYDAALERFKEAARLEPSWYLVNEDLSKAYNNIGARDAQKGNWAAAEGHFAQAVDLSSNDRDILCNLGKARIFLNKFAEAAKTLNDGRRFSEGWCQDLPSQIALPSSIAGNDLEELRRAVSIAPEVSFFTFNLLRAYRDLDRRCEALNVCSTLEYKSFDKSIPVDLRVFCEEAKEGCRPLRKGPARHRDRTPQEPQ